MGEEKSIEQLEAEYKAILTEKLDAIKKEKQAQELAAQKAKEKAEYEEEFKKKYNLKAISRLETPEKKDETNMLAMKEEHIQFVSDFARHKGLPVTGRNYQEIIETLAYGKKAIMDGGQK